MLSYRCVMGFLMTAASGSFSAAQLETPVNAERLPLAPPVQGTNVSNYIEDYSTVSFEGRDYGFEEAAPALLEILAAGDRLDRMRREKASQAMSAISRHPVVATYLPELLRAAARETTWEGRELFDNVVDGIDDPALLGYFEDVLRTETEPTRRFMVAHALARWNVLTGVRELVELARCDYWINVRYLAGEALMALRDLSETNNWGMPVPKCFSLPKGVKPSESAEFAALQADLLAWLDANAHRFPEVPVALRDRWRVYLKPPAENHGREREALKQRVHALIERLVGRLPEKDGQPVSPGRVTLLARAWSLPIDYLAPQMLHAAGQDWYLKSVEAFCGPQLLADAGVGAFLRAQDLHGGPDSVEHRMVRREYVSRAAAQLAIPRFALRSGTLADHPVSAAERESANEQLKPALAALARACLPASGAAKVAPSEGASKRFVEVATSAFFWGYTARLKPTEQWDALARRAVSDWAEVWASDEARVPETAPRLGEALFWASIDDPDARLLYRAALSDSAQAGKGE